MRLRSFGSLICSPLFPIRIHFAPDDPTAPPATPPAPAPNPSPAPPSGEAPIMNQQQLNERLERERRTHLKSLGFESEEQAKQFKAQFDEQEKKKQEEERNKLSETERYRHDLEAERRKNMQLEERYAASQFERKVNKSCAELGIKNVDYAMFEVLRKVDGLPKDQQLDVDSYLKELAAESDMKRASLGYVGTAPQGAPEQNPVPITTTPTGPGVVPPPAPAPGPAPTLGGDVFAMDDATWRNRKAALGLP